MRHFKHLTFTDRLNIEKWLKEGMKLHAALHACTTMNENQVQQTRQHDKI